MAAKSRTKAFTIFYGEEGYLLDRDLQKAKTWPDRMITLLQGKETSEGQILEALSQMSFDGDDTVVIVENAEKVKLTKEFLEYAEKRNPKDLSSVLVAFYRKAKLTHGWDKLAPKARLVNHPTFKPWQDKEIYKRIRKETDMLGMVLTDPAYKTLRRVYGESTSGMVNELRKLAFIVNPGGDVTRDHVLSVSPKQLPIQPWDVSEAAANKSVKQALTYASLLFRYMGEGAAVPIVSATMKLVEKLMVARSILDQGKGAEEIAGALGIHTYVVEKTIVPVARKHTVLKLLKQMQMLCELEVRVKGTAQSKRTQVELALLSFAT